MPLRFSIPALVLLLPALAACTTTAPVRSTAVSTAFYDVNGRTVLELDQELKRRGPQVHGRGRALAAANIGLSLRLSLAPVAGGCAVADARVPVKADVVLPRWRQRAGADVKLGRMWDSFAAYAAWHEQQHVAIAEHHAARIETAVEGLRPAPDCATMRARALATADTLLVEHRRAQDAFDAREAKRPSVEKALAGLRPPRS